MIRSLLTFCSLLFFGPGFSQSLIHTPISGSFEDIQAVELLQIIENNYGVKIYYEPKRTPYYKVSLTFDNTPLYQALRKIVAGTVLSVQFFEDKVVLLPKMERSRENVLRIIQGWESGAYEKPVESSAESIAYEFGNFSAFDGRAAYVLSGKITDRYSGEPIIGALIRDASAGQGAVTDAAGNFQYETTGGSLNLIVSYLGYRSIELDINLYEDARLDLTMTVASIDLGEVVIEAQSSFNKVDDPGIGQELLSRADIKTLPSFLGEADVINGIERLPGVSTVTEASSGFNVRGGAVDQNLILLEEALIFNASHALGFFSIFPPDAVGGISLYKGHIPARYGGRLSSVLAVDLKDPHQQSWHGSGGVGIASARFQMEGPLVRNKTSALVGLRSSYSDWLLRLADDVDVRNSNLYFGDGLVKVRHEVNARNQLALTAYLSHDNFRFTDDFGFAWNSNFVNLHWQHWLRDSLVLSSHLISGTYKSRQFEPEGTTAFNLENGIRYWKVKSQLTLESGRHFLLFGADGIRYDMHPEKLTPYDNDSKIFPESVPKNQGYELALYAEDTWTVAGDFTLTAGLRSSFFLALGPEKVYEYIPGLPKSEETLTDSLRFQAGEIAQSYAGLEPRLSLHWRLTPSMALKGSYNLQRQYLHRVANNTVATPVDRWQLSNTHIRPSYVHNLSAGAYRNFHAAWSGSLEAFYRASQGTLQYKDFAELALNPRLETELLAGAGRAYGVELLIQKHSGRTTGQLAYTFSRSRVRVGSVFPEAQINAGEWFPSDFDQPHQLNIEIKHRLNRLLSVQVAFAYRSGRPITPPVRGYQLGTVIVTDYSGRNAFRIPDYHRLDIGFYLDQSESKAKGLRNSFALNFYNIFGRQNPFTVFFRPDDNNIPRAYQLAILGKMFPSLTWNFNF